MHGSLCRMMRAQSTRKDQNVVATHTSHTSVVDMLAAAGIVAVVRFVDARLSGTWHCLVLAVVAVS